MLKPPPLGHVVEDYMLGATHIIICDDCCVSEEECRKIIEQIGYDAYNDLVAAKRRELEEAG